MIRKICFFSTSFAMHKQVRMSYAEKYLPKKVKLFFLTPPKQNKYNLKRTQIIEIDGNKINFTLGLRKFCKKNKIDLLVNLGTVNESFGMVFATFGLKTKYIINLVGDMWDELKVQKKIRKKAVIISKILLSVIPFILAKKIIQSSSDIRDKIQKNFFFIKNKVYSCDLIIDEKLFSPKNKTQARKKLNLPLEKDIILSVGRVSYLKGSDILFKLVEKNPEKLFIVIGEIIDLDYEKQKFPNLLLILSAKGKELVDYYNSADLFLFPSRVEGYGLVQREAMLCETPALVSDITSLRLTEYALKANPDAEDMQNQINIFFSMSKKEREKLGKMSRKYIIQKNSYDNLKDSLRNLLLD